MVVSLPAVPLPVGRSIRWFRSIAPGVGTRTNWAGRPCPRGRNILEPPVRLRVGDRFDVLEMPAEAGIAGLRHLAPASPVAVQGGRMRLLVAAGSANELPGLLDWLEWGALTLDLTATGLGGVMEAPLPPRVGRPGTLQGAAVWLRPPSRGARSRPRCRHCRPWGAVVAPPISYDSWTRWRHIATGCGCGACAPSPWPCRRPSIRRWPSRRPRGWTREHGRGR